MRKAIIKRKTKETSIEMKINLDGTGKNKISCGVPFFDHMLVLMFFNAGFDVELKAKGDRTGNHHLIEDLGIVIGQGLDKALSDRKGIKRYGFMRVPMDEASAETVIDISGRPYVIFEADFVKKGAKDYDSGMDFSLTEDFLWGIARNAKLTLHCRVICGKNNHHKIEALFKSLGRSLGEAVRQSKKSIPSTKGRL